MKKLFSLLLAAVLALGLTTIAWAVAEEEPAVRRARRTRTMTRIVIEKCYRLVNDGAVSPAETFHFTLTTLGVTDSTETLDTMPRFTDADGAPITGFDISFAEGVATGGRHRQVLHADAAGVRHRGYLLLRDRGGGGRRCPARQASPTTARSCC